MANLATDTVGVIIKDLIARIKEIQQAKQDAYTTGDYRSYEAQEYELIRWKIKLEKFKKSLQ